MQNVTFGGGGVGGDRGEGGQRGGGTEGRGDRGEGGQRGGGQRGGRIFAFSKIISAFKNLPNLVTLLTTVKGKTNLLKTFAILYQPMIALVCIRNLWRNL